MKTKQLFITLTAVALCLSGILFISGCKKDNKPGVESLKFDAATKTVQVGESVTLTVTITPEDAEYTEIKVSSSAQDVATAEIKDKSVTVKGVKAGETDVVVTVESSSATCHVTVPAPEPQKYTVKLNAKQYTICVGKTVELTATVEPTEGANAVWKSGDEKVAKVTGDALKGTVTGVAEGKTFIYCIVNENFKDSCEVTVVPSTANCYIVTAAGSYSFKTVKGNSTESVGDVKSAEVLWETFGTDKAPNKGDIISNVKYENGEISYTVTDNKGNAVIAAKDGNGNILWSWHIWCTDQPSEQNYNNQAGTMMDRNLGATSATKGDVGALGLLYQWGRKDPFLGSSSISSDVIAKSTGTWESATSSTASTGTFAYAVQHPMQFIKSNDNNYDWYYTGTSSTDNTRWQTSDKAKGLYDPCPVGWRVPDGGDSGVWCTAFNTTSEWTKSDNWDGTHNGMDFGTTDKKLVGTGSAQCWYPAAGYRRYGDGSLSNVGSGSGSWSCTPSSNEAYNLAFDYNGSVYPSYDYYRAHGMSVRCLKEE